MDRSKSPIDRNKLRSKSPLDRSIGNISNNRSIDKSASRVKNTKDASPKPNSKARPSSTISQDRVLPARESSASKPVIYQTGQSLEYKSQFGQSNYKRASSKNSSDKSKSPLKKSTVSHSSTSKILHRPPSSDIRVSTNSSVIMAKNRPSVSPSKSKPALMQTLPTLPTTNYMETRNSNEQLIYNAMRNSIDKGKNNNLNLSNTS